MSPVDSCAVVPPAARHRRTGRPLRAAVLGAVGLAAALLVPAATHAAAKPVPSAPPAASAQSPFGPNVKIFDPSMPQAQIQATVDAIAKQQVDNEMGSQRYALLFKPGTYGSAANPLVFQVGYYTEVAGLGLNPGDVTINGEVNVYDRCGLANGDCNALDNFWRSLSNLTINPVGNSGCYAKTEFWAVSQAAPMRRIAVNGNTTFMDYCGDYTYGGSHEASGGFVADSALNGGIVNGSQQQFLWRNTVLGSNPGAVWNQVFSGDVGAPAQSFPNPPYTTIPATPASREKPYLYIDGSGRWNVFVPAAATNSTGPTWLNGQTAGTSRPLSDFDVVSPSDSAHSINNALSREKDLLLTPGVYDYADTLKIKRADTVVLGMGLATITPTSGNVAISVGDVGGVDIAGITIDAGAVNSPVLLQVGTARGNNGRPHNVASDPTALQDVFFRIGGPHAGKATVSLEVNSDNVILDDIWAWRADHGVGVGWTVNTADNGVVVNGDNVTATGLFVEHYQKYDVVWNGDNGKVVFFQNEMPYDGPNQAAWQHDGVNGYAAIHVANDVTTFQGWGLGSYIYTNVDPSLHATNAFEVPNTPGVRMHDLLTVSLNGAGTIDHVINGVGAPVTPTIQGPSFVVSYPV